MRLLHFFQKSSYSKINSHICFSLLLLLLSLFLNIITLFVHRHHLLHSTDFFLLYSKVNYYCHCLFRIMIMFKKKLKACWHFIWLVAMTMTAKDATTPRHTVIHHHCWYSMHIYKYLIHDRLSHRLSFFYIQMVTGMRSGLLQVANKTIAYLSISYCFLLKNFVVIYLQQKRFFLVMMRIQIFKASFTVHVVQSERYIV